MRYRMLICAGRIIWAGLCLLCLSNRLFAQREECRQPTAPESQAVDHASRVIRQTVEAPLAGLGWALQPRKSDQLPLSVATDANPKRPLMSCWPIYDATFRMTEANPRYAKLRSLAEQGDTAAQTWMAACIKANYRGCEVKPEAVTNGIRAKTASTLAVRATENDPYMHGPHESPIRKLDAPPGIAVAYRFSDDEYEQNMTLCVGPWKPDVVFGSGTRLVLFPFQHPAETPFIENLCFHIRAVPETADEILRQVNWRDLNSALTK